MSDPANHPGKHSNVVRNAYVATAVTAFLLLGYFVAFWLASFVVPDAARFYSQGGSVGTGRLHGFYCLWGLGELAAGSIGAYVGRGLYVAWQRG